MRDVSNMEPQVSAPSSPANVRPVSAWGSQVDQVVIGLTNGRINDQMGRRQF